MSVDNCQAQNLKNVGNPGIGVLKKFSKTGEGLKGVSNIKVPNVSVKGQCIADQEKILALLASWSFH